MQERIINEEEAERIIRLWQNERFPIEVLIRFSQGLMQAHPGQIRLEPEGQVVIANVTDKNHYLTTMLDIFAFQTIRISEMDNAITFEEPFAPSETFQSITLARRNP